MMMLALRDWALRTESCLVMMLAAARVEMWGDKPGGEDYLGELMG
jgi:hypothetical protein